MAYRVGSVPWLIVSGAMTMMVASCVLDTSGLTASVSPSNDAGMGDADAGRDGGNACSPGAVVLPVRAFDATPAGVMTQVCALDNVLVADGKVAGLDRSTTSGLGMIDGQYVVGCVGVELAAPITSMTVRAGVTPNACGTPCVGSACSSGDTVFVFAGSAEGSYKYQGELLHLKSTVADYSFALTPDPPSKRFIVICREAWGADAQDIGIDSISGTCE